MDRSILKQSIDEWREFFLKSRHSLIIRDIVPPLPTLDLAVTLIGLRRSGKTHLAFQMSQNIPEEKVLYYNFEDPIFYTDNNVANLDLLLSVAQEYRSDRLGLLILDEIQVVDGWERWLRKLIDQKKFKIIVTGSSAKMLSSELATSLTGRTLEFHIWPLSLNEIIKFKDSNTSNLRSKDQLLQIVREAMQWGCLPEVVKLPEENRKKLLKQYLNDIVLKDVISRNQVRNKLALDQILTYYLTNISSLHSYNGVAKAFNFDVATASDYTRMLKEAFFISEVSRYHNNLKVQSRDPRKIYITDLGFRTVGARSVNDDTGKLLENLVYCELIRRGKNIYYFKGKQEVDFITVENYKPIEAIQVCASDLQSESTWNREIDALVEAMNELKVKSGTIVSYDREENIKVDRHNIKIIPSYNWLMEK